MDGAARPSSICSRHPILQTPRKCLAHVVEIQRRLAGAGGSPVRHCFSLNRSGFTPIDWSSITLFLPRTWLMKSETTYQPGVSRVEAVLNSVVLDRNCAHGRFAR